MCLTLFPYFISYRNTGVILTVQPCVNNSGFVTLTIEQEVSDVMPTTASGIDSPTFRNRRIKSSVTVKPAYCPNRTTTGLCH